MTERQRQIVGYALLIGSIAAFFWWGYRFEIWGKRLSFDLSSLGFISWVPVGAFGVGYASGGLRPAVTGAAWVASMLAAALVLGLLLGNYR